MLAAKDDDDERIEAPATQRAAEVRPAAGTDGVRPPDAADVVLAPERLQDSLDPTGVRFPPEEQSSDVTLSPTSHDTNPRGEMQRALSDSTSNVRTNEEGVRGPVVVNDVDDKADVKPAPNDSGELGVGRQTHFAQANDWVRPPRDIRDDPYYLEPIGPNDPEAGRFNTELQAIRDHPGGSRQALAEAMGWSGPEDVNTPISDLTDQSTVQEKGSSSLAVDRSNDDYERGIVESLGEVEGIRPERWESANSEERLGALNEVEQRMAEHQGRPAVEVRIQEAGGGSFGFYDHDGKRIFVGSYALAHAGAQENVDTIVHEGRHAYQYHAVEHPGFHPDENEVAAWRENLKPENYVRFEEDPELYANQPVERDAWAYGRRIARGVYGE